MVRKESERNKVVHTTSMSSMLVTANTFVLYVRETSGTEECGRRWERAVVQYTLVVVAGAVHTTRITLRLQAGQAVGMYVLYVASVIIEVSCPVVCMSVHVLRYSFVSVR